MSEKKSSAVFDPRMPILRRGLPQENPGVPRSTRNMLMPSCRAAGSVFANTQTQSATPPLVMKILLPLIT